MANRFGEGAAFQTLVVAAGEFSGGGGGLREEIEELLEAHSIEGELRWELPEERTKLCAEGERSGGEEVGESLLHIFKLEHVGDVAAAFDGELEVAGRLL